MCCVIYYLYIKAKEYLNKRKIRKANQEEYAISKVMYNFEQLEKYNNMRRSNPIVCIT